MSLAAVHRGLLRAWLPLKFRLRSAGARAAIGRLPRPYRLHVGCGRIRLDGWVNLDSDPMLAEPDVLWDLRRGLPVPDGSCEAIYSEHVIEHIPVEDGVAFLRECHRALRPGGRVRIATPSLDEILEKSCAGDWRDQDWLSWPEFRFISTRAEMLNISFRWWGHQWLYDREELHRRLREAGFERIADARWGESQVPVLRGLETRLDSRLICEATKGTA